MIGSLGRCLPAAAVGLVAVTVACSSSNPVYTPGPVGPTNRPSSNPSPITSPVVTPSATPTHSVTPTPSPSPSPTSTPTGVPLACTTATDPLPGTYTNIITAGNVSGTTYTQAAGSGIYQVEAYTVGTPPPPTPSPSPTSTPTVGPTPTPTPVTYNVYTGAYAIPTFSGSGAGGTYTANATNGCFALLATQNGQPIPNQTYNSIGIGFPVFDPSVTYVNVTPVAQGAITSFTFTGLGPSMGTGTFTLDNNVTGTATVQATQVVTFEHARRMFQRIRAQHAFLGRAPYRY